jgi:hypothetical protein
MNMANLLLNVDRLRLVKVRLGLVFDLAIKAVEGDPLPPLLFLFRNRLAGNRIEDIGSLAGEPFKIVGHVDRQVGRSGPCFCLGFLFFPSWIEEFD